jgi:hypothetical protein
LVQSSRKLRVERAALLLKLTWFRLPLKLTLWRHLAGRKLEEAWLLIQLIPALEVVVRPAGAA